MTSHLPHDATFARWDDRRDRAAGRRAAAAVRPVAAPAPPSPGGAAPRARAAGRRAAAAARPVAAPALEARIAIRRAFPDDAVTVARLAALDSRRVPAGELLLAEVDGVPRAAL